MCGIAGIVDLTGQRHIDRDLLQRMNHALYHRGPDEGGLHIEPGVGFAHRRLSIIDLSGGQQPLFNEDGSVVVVFNGEIYNFKELFLELSAAGHRFRTQCDTEVIVHAWEEWGEACVERFRGMFAIALWDRNQRTLFLARDRLGVKPLYYAVLANGELLFGSELKALLVHPKLERRINEQAVEEYLALGYVPDPKCIYATVSKLPPGHIIVIKTGQPVFTPKLYWDVPFAVNASRSEERAVEELGAHLEDAVRIRMVAEVPLGAFLSGGVDSSAVVAVMAGLSATPVNTCAIGFGDPKYDESQYAARVAAQYRTRHYTEQVAAGDFSALNQLAAVYDEPFADASALPTYRVCQLARKHVTVALSGDGGDESFAGYRRYKWHLREERLRSLLPAGLRRPVFGSLGKAYPKLDWAPRLFRAKTTLQSLAMDTVEGYFHGVSVIASPLRDRLLSPAFKRRLQGYNALHVFRSHQAQSPTPHPLHMIQYIDLKTYLAGGILTKVDRASMAHGLEVREPLLDHKLIEWASSLPSHMKLRRGESKYLLKKSLEHRLPRTILYRPKQGFSVPIAGWFRNELRNELRSALLGSVMADCGIFNERTVRRLVDEHQSGIGDHSAALWSLLMFEAFLRQSSGRIQSAC